MSFLIFSYQKQSIIARKANLEMRLLELNKKLLDLQSYTAAIADGSVSMNDLMNCPGSMFNKMTLYMNTSHQIGYSEAQQKYALMSQVPGAIPQMADAQLQQQYTQSIFKSLYDQSKEKFADQEQKLLKVEDTRIQQEKARIETQLKMLEAMEEQVTKAEDEGAKKSAPQFVA